MDFQTHRMRYFLPVHRRFDFMNFFSSRSRRPANSNIPLSQAKKGQNNFFPFLPSANTAPMRSTATMAGNFLSSQNGGQTSMINGDMGQNFPSMNVTRERKKKA